MQVSQVSAGLFASRAFEIEQIVSKSKFVSKRWVMFQKVCPLELFDLLAKFGRIEL